MGCIPEYVQSPIFRHPLCRDFEAALTRAIRVENDEPGIMTPGHVFTIEPVILQGTKTGVWTWPDGWTLSTDNGNRGAMFEHTCLVTEKGVDVLTAQEGE